MKIRKCNLVWECYTPSHYECYDFEDVIVEDLEMPVVVRYDGFNWIIEGFGEVYFGTFDNLVVCLASLLREEAKDVMHSVLDNRK